MMDGAVHCSGCRIVAGEVSMETAKLRPSRKRILKPFAGNGFALLPVSVGADKRQTIR